MFSLLTLDNLYLYLAIALLGLAIGSFCNVVIHRLPIMLHNLYRQECMDFLNKESTVKTAVFNLFLPRSHCPKCGKQIAIRHNIPILSYILLHGKCRHCQKKISWHYPLVELLSCSLSITVVYNCGMNWHTVALLTLTWALLIIIFIDLYHQIIPDILSVSLLWLGLLVNTSNSFTTPEQAILGAVCGYSSLWLVATTFKLVRKQEGMGHGDFKLLAVFGAWLGCKVLPVIILGASLLGIIVGVTLIICRKHQYTKPMPFGPYLATAGWTMFFVEHKLFSWYKPLLDFVQNQVF